MGGATIEVVNIMSSRPDAIWIALLGEDLTAVAPICQRAHRSRTVFIELADDGQNDQFQRSAYSTVDEPRVSIRTMEVCMVTRSLPVIKCSALGLGR